jgi:penicillin amidase
LFMKEMWQGRFHNVPGSIRPLQERTMQLMKADSLPALYQKEQFHAALVNSFKHTTDSMNKLEKSGAEWYKLKNTSVNHLAKLPAFSFDHLKIGGWGNAINATKGNHGPSWRMVVQMGKEIEAYGIYPGGQSGNPGSKHYADYLQDWVDGRYNRLLFLPNEDKQSSSEIKYTWKVN